MANCITCWQMGILTCPGLQCKDMRGHTFTDLLVTRLCRPPRTVEGSDSTRSMMKNPSCIKDSHKFYLPNYEAPNPKPFFNAVYLNFSQNLDQASQPTDQDSSSPSQWPVHCSAVVVSQPTLPEMRLRVQGLGTLKKLILTKDYTFSQH